MSDLVDEARNMEDNHLRTGDLDQATLYGNLATEIERLEHENKAWRTKDNKSERLIHELMQQRDALKGQIKAYKKDVFRDLGRDEETGLILFRTWKDQAHIYKEQRDELAAALRVIRDEGPMYHGVWCVSVADKALAKLDADLSDNREGGDT